MKCDSCWRVVRRTLLGLGTGGVLAIVILLLAGPAWMARAETGEDAKRQDIRRLLVITGSADMGLQMVDQMIANYQKHLPQVPPAFWEAFREDVHLEEMIDLVVPIYEKHLTHQEVRVMIDFYSTPIGRRVVEAMPAILFESTEAGHQWGQAIGARAMAKLRASGQWQTPDTMRSGEL